MIRVQHRWEREINLMLRGGNPIKELIMFIEEKVKEAKKEVYLEILSKKFKGNVREMLIWLGGEFKDVPLDDSHLSKEKETKKDCQTCYDIHCPSKETYDWKGGLSNLL